MAISNISRSQLLTIEKAAEALGVTPRMIRRLTASRQLPYVKVGRLVRIRQGDSTEFLNALASAASSRRRTLVVRIF